MLSPETLQSYRKMTPGERLRLTFKLMQGVDRMLCQGTSDQVARKFELLRRANDRRNENMLQAIMATQKSSTVK